MYLKRIEEFWRSQRSYVHLGHAKSGESCISRFGIGSHSQLISHIWLYLFLHFTHIFPRFLHSKRIRS